MGGAQGKYVSDYARTIGICRKTMYEWLNRYRGRLEAGHQELVAITASHPTEAATRVSCRQTAAPVKVMLDRLTVELPGSCSEEDLSKVLRAFRMVF